MTQDVDHPTIKDDDQLWRRIPDLPQMIKKLPDGTCRPSSAAFKDGLDGEVSVHLAKLATKKKALAKYPEYGLVEIDAGLPRSLGHSVIYKPLPEDPSHAVIVPPQSHSRSRRQRDAEEMALAAHWLVYPRSERSRRCSVWIHQLLSALKLKSVKRP
ncbi:MAG TPA: hypothetical protein VGA01_04705 [Candidatus Binatia bacterium]